MVVTPLGAILDWTMGTPAGSPRSATPDQRDAEKDLDRLVRFLDSPDSLYVLNDSPSGWKSAAAHGRSVSSSSSTTPPTNTGFSVRGTISLPDASRTASVRSPPPTMTLYRQRLRVDSVPNRH